MQQRCALNGCSTTGSQVITGSVTWVLCCADNFAPKSAAATQDEKVMRLADMGFTAEAASVALQSAHGDENAALELLLSAV